MPFSRSTFVILIFILFFSPGIIPAQDEIEPVENSEEETEDATEYVSQLDIDELRRRIYGEDPEELLSFNLKDSNVSLFLTGSWKGSLQGNFGISRSPIGFGFAAPETPLLFKQEADLTMALWINSRWFLEANFLDDSANNTYRAGYQGHKGEFLQYAGIGNTGLDFPSFPYLDLGGDSPSSFGFYSRMESKALNIHTLFRYDAASREERVFYGSRERTYSYVQPRDSIRAVSFALPDTNIDSEITVYIEDEKGGLTDLNGRRWRLALSSEYAAGKSQGLLELSIRPNGMVAAAYSKNSDNRPWLSSMGSYNGAEGDFLYGVQQWFDDIRLENYPQCGGNALRPGEITIGSVSALVIYEPGTFSPFERQNRYDATSSSSEVAVLVSLSSGTQIGGYELTRLETNAVSADIPLFIAAVSQRSIYELLPEGNFSQRDPRVCWPLADRYPQIYLPGVSVLTEDIILRFTNYSGASGYFIGTDVVPGSIQVWRSGIQDTNFSYNSSAGEVNISGAVGQNEIIRVTYLKRNEETRLGSIAAGIGAVYRNGESPFSARGALGIRWNLTESTSFTEEGVLSTGTVGFGSKAEWNYDNLKAHITAGLAFEQTDTTGLYRAAGMEGNETILVLQSENAFLSHPPAGLSVTNRSDLIYRNYYSNSVIGSTLMPVTWNSSVISDLNRPYPVKDPLLGDNQLLAAEFSLNSGEWTGYQVPLDFYAGIFAKAVEIEIPYRFYGFTGDNTNLRLIIQIGSLSPKDYAINENIDLIWEEEILAGSEIINTDPAIARFVLGEMDYLKLGDVKFLRVFAVYEGVDSISGRVLIAPPIIRGSAFRPIIYDGNTVSGINDFSAVNRVKAWETMDSGFNNLESAYSEIINRLHATEGTQRVLKIEWENMQAGYSAGIDGRIGELPLSDYRELSFFIKGPAILNGTLSFIAARGPDSIPAGQLEANIPLDAFREGQWSKVTIRYQGSDTGVSVDGTSAPGASFNYRPVSRQIDKPDGKSGYIAVLINSPQLDSGSFCIDEIILEDPLLVYRMNAGGAFEYRKQGTLIGINRTPVLSDFQVSTAVESEFRTGADNDLGISGSFANRTTAEIFIVGSKVQGNLFFTAAKDTFLWSADHNISRNIGPFSFKEIFFASPGERTARHNINMAFSSDFFAKFDADAFYEYSRLRQKWNLGMGYRSRNTFIPTVTLNTDALWMSKSQIEENDGYGKLWLKTFEPVIPDKGSLADNRRTQAQFVITERTQPVGAVITLEGNTNFAGANSITYSFSSAFLDVPLTFKKSSLNLRAGRCFKKQLYFYGNDFYDDGRKFFESINDSLPLWGVMPGYSLFSPGLEEAMDKSMRDSPSMELAQYTAFNDHFSATMNFPPVYNPASFIIPSRASARLERVLEQKLDTKTDFLNLGIGAGFSAVNMFGSLGYLPLFKFYHNDEFTHAIETAVVFSKENVSWRIQSIIGAGFRGFKGGSLNLVNTTTLRSEGYWLETFNTNMTTPAEKSFLGIFYDWIAKAAARQSSWLNLTSLLSKNYEQLRKESLELTFDKTTDYLRWNITAGHESIIRILGRLEFTAFIKLRCGEDSYREIFIFDAILGTTLRISF